MLRGKFIALNAHIRKEEKAQINNRRCCLKNIEIEAQTKTEVSRRKEIMDKRVEINVIKNIKNNREKQ